MLRKLRYVPKEHLVQKFSELTGMSYDAAERLAEREGLDVVSDYIEAYLSMPKRQFQNKRSYARRY